jgi:long-chain acyl-CoA synthetase
MASLVSHLRESVREHPEATALSIAGNETSYAELWAMTGRFAGALRDRGIGPGDPVALYLPNLPQFVVAFHGVLRTGGVVVPVNPQYKARELRHILGDSAARGIVTTADRVPEIEDVHEHTLLQFMVTADGSTEFSTGFSEFLAESPEVDYWSFAERDDDDVAVLPYTSGTTGQPKGVRLTHGNLASNTAATADLVPGGIGPEDGSLGALPLFHIYGMTVVMNATLTSGGTFHPLPAWDAERAMSLIDEAGISIFHGVPAMYNDMLNHPDADDYDLSSLRLAGVGGSGIPVEVLRGFEEQFDATIYEGYGLTETSPVTHFNDPGRGRRVGSIGRPIDDVEARVVDEDFEPVNPVDEGPLSDDTDLSDVTGEIVVAGPNVMAGYHDNEDANEAAFTEADGRRWFHTGDVGYSDEDGFFYVVDRDTDVIVSGGYNVYPREVEELLYEHDAVADAAVVGIPDDRRGETVKAYVVTAPGAEVTAEEIREFCLSNLAEYKHPRVVEFVDELPRTTTGKVKKFELRAAADPVDDADRDADQNGETAGDDGEDPATDDGDAADDVTADEAGDAAGDGDDGTAGAATPDAEDGVTVAGGDTASDSAAGGGVTIDESDADGSDDRGLQDLDGISEHRAEALAAADLGSVEALRVASREEIAQVEGFGDALATRIMQQVEDGAPDAK